MKTFSSFILFLSTILFFHSQDFPEKFEENSKFGVKYLGKTALPAIYDNVILYYPSLLIVVKGKEKTIYDNKMSLMFKNSEIVKYVFWDDYEKLQILIKGGKQFSYDDDGLITDPLKLNPNETIDTKCITFNGKERYSVKSGKIHIKDLDNDYFSRDFEYKEFGKKVKFLNNKNNMELEYCYSYERKKQQDSIKDVAFDEEIYFDPLKTNYIVSKIKGHYGVWDFRDEKIILPYDYQKITPFRSYLLLEKNGLATFYPNIGTEPNYKKLEPYIGYFARFETIDGKKGWVDRKGKEYFDE